MIRPRRPEPPQARREAVSSVLAALAVALVAIPAGSGATLRAGAKPRAIELRVLRLVDRSRSIRLPSGKTEPRTLVTYVRYPAGQTGGPYPLIVFGHGFAVTPAPYAALLQAWARAGYVVAAPVFPLENANAPGGPNESDIVNQPRDMRFVIRRLLAASAARTGFLHGLIDPREIAVAGHSDGAETALLAAYDPVHYNPRIRAAVLLSGAQTPSGGIAFLKPSAALLATQGTADTVNPPSITNAFFALAPRPKFLLELLGAEHLPPYTSEQPQLSVVERVTIAFLDHYLKNAPISRLLEHGTVRGVSKLISRP